MTPACFDLGPAGGKARSSRAYSFRLVLVRRDAA